MDTKLIEVTNELTEVKRENKLLRDGISGNFNLDAWLDWKNQVVAYTKTIKYQETMSCADDAEALGAVWIAEHLRKYAADRLNK